MSSTYTLVDLVVKFITTDWCLLSVVFFSSLFRVYVYTYHTGMHHGCYVPGVISLQQYGMGVPQVAIVPLPLRAGTEVQVLCYSLPSTRRTSIVACVVTTGYISGKKTCSKLIKGLSVYLQHAAAFFCNSLFLGAAPAILLVERKMRQGALIFAASRLRSKKKNEKTPHEIPPHPKNTTKSTAAPRPRPPRDGVRRITSHALAHTRSLP